jgi:hypothetical protein
VRYTSDHPALIEGTALDSARVSVTCEVRDLSRARHLPVGCFPPGGTRRERVALRSIPLRVVVVPWVVSWKLFLPAASGVGLLTHWQSDTKQIGWVGSLHGGGADVRPLVSALAIECTLPSRDHPQALADP